MFFFPPGLSPEQTEKLFKYLNDGREKQEEKKRKEEQKKKEEEYQKKLAEYHELLRKAPTTSISSMIGYTQMLNYCNPDSVLNKSK
jgi:5-methylcytosine-specific restriction endonuclease McrBC GTP-binding regulatory subunit McrB